jgi:hypothetical protein
MTHEPRPGRSSSSTGSRPVHHIDAARDLSSLHEVRPGRLRAVRTDGLGTGHRAHHATGDGILGLDFAEQHHIRCTAWDLGTFHRGNHMRHEWALRMQRHDDDGTARSLTWLFDWNPGAADVDWDWAIFLLARDTHDGRLSFDAYIEQHLTPRDDEDIARGEHQAWVRAEHLWHQVRGFFGRDAALTASFFSILPPEH